MSTGRPVASCWCHIVLCWCRVNVMLCHGVTLVLCHVGIMLCHVGVLLCHGVTLVLCHVVSCWCCHVGVMLVSFCVMLVLCHVGVMLCYGGVCQIKLRSLQSIRLSTSTDYGCAFGPRKASKVEKPSSRGVSSLHRWSLMLLPVFWLMPLRFLHTCICVYSAWRVSHYCSFSGAGTHDSDGPLGLNVVTY